MNKPKEPVRSPYFNFNMFECPNCGCLIGDFVEKCDCGQLIDWSKYIKEETDAKKENVL